MSDVRLRNIKPVDFERACYGDWLAAHHEDQGGWLQCATMGRSGRANAVWPLYWRDEYSLDQVFMFCESWAQRHDIPLMFKLADGAVAPADLPSFLAARGFAPQPESETLVMARALDCVSAPEREIAWATQAEDEYFAVLRAASPSAEDFAERRDMISRMRTDAIFPIARSAGASAAIGLGRRTGAMVGLYLMRTAPEMRRQGLARDIVRTICAWGRFHGVALAHLQVEEENQAAVALYASEGFETRYRYRYWRRA